MTIEFRNRFGITDYIVFALSLVASLGIGVYSAFSGRKQKTTDDFYFGNRDLNIVAVALSMAATFLSAIAVLGIPSEIYSHGISYSLLAVPEVTIKLICIFLFIPFFYRLNMTSVYEYFEHRFNRFIRQCACALYVFNMLLYVAVVLYAPALALSQVSGLSLWASIITSGLICTVYTALGGMKAVVWTDAFQMVIMMVGVMTVLIIGIVSTGGVANIWETNKATGRLDIDVRPDPTIRHTVMSLLFGGFFTALPFGLNQATVQRYLSVKSAREAQKMFAISVPVILFWKWSLIFVGLTMFSYYKGCDPLLAGRINRPDQMVAVYILDALGHIHGFSGLFTAVVYAATLSTVSSGVNSIVVVLNEDFIKPVLDSRKTPVGENFVVHLSKVLSLVVGCLAIAIAFATSAMGTGLIQFCISINGMLQGPLLGLFFCGMILPYCNSKGAIVGLLAGLFVTFWIGTGAVLSRIPSYPFPVSTDSCVGELSTMSNINVTFVTSYSNRTIMNQNVTAIIGDCDGPQIPRFHCIGSRKLSGLTALYSLSYQYYSFVGFFTTITFATIASFLTGRQDSSVIPERYFLFNVMKSEKNKTHNQEKSRKRLSGHEYFVVDQEGNDLQLNIMDQSDKKISRLIAT